MGPEWDGIDRREGGGKVSLGEVVRLINRNKELEDERHERLRRDMATGFDLLREQYVLTTEAARELENRTLTIEIERRTEAKYARRDGAIFGSLFGMIGSAIIALFVKWWKS